MTPVVCEHHEHTACLELVGGEIDVEDGAVAFAELHYRCREYPALEGVYRAAEGVETTHGAVVRVEPAGRRSTNSALEVGDSD